jgi:2-oxoglutarate dehydrogenase E2 component (dihydrolipoamide succinyltransferase)
MAEMYVSDSVEPLGLYYDAAPVLQVVYRDYVDVSVAVASPRGLVVPVLRNVEGLSMSQIELNLGDLANKARADKITMEDMAGGTFTISNGGVFGSMMGTPIINPPQSAILGMHAIKQRAVVVNVRICMKWGV